MANPRGRGRLGLVRQMCVLAAATASVAGCVGMPSNGAAVQFSASPQSSGQDGNLIGSEPLPPQAGQGPVAVVQGFLTAADSYPLYGVAKQYLTSSAVSSWQPGDAVKVFSKLNGPNQIPVPSPTPTPKARPTRSPRVMVEVSGTVQATFNGEGQYVSALNPEPASAYDWKFDLVKVGGQWRISNPPNFRMLSVTDFPYFYKAQDLYFMDPQNQVLVPDSVFEPMGLTVSQSLTQLVDSLTVGPKTPWLSNAVDTKLPPHVSVQEVLNDGSTVMVNLKVPKTAEPSAKQLEFFSAQLVWTLIGPAASSSPSAISSVVLELNGEPWTPPFAPCPGGRVPGQAQKLAPYSCFDPYPSSPASFYYVDRGQSWTRCGAESMGLSGSIGMILPLVGRTGAFSSPSCAPREAVRETSTALPVAQPASLPAVTMAAVSPDGSDLAIVTAGKGDLYVGKMSGLAAPFASARPRLTGGGITSLSWDRNDDLWVTQNGVIYELVSGGKPVQVQYNGTVTDLAVAPDGVRLAFIVQTGRDATGRNTSALELAANGAGAPSSVEPGSPDHPQIRPATAVGPGLTNPTSVTWYDADDLLVVNDTSNGPALMEVPVDGQQPVPELTPSGLTSITADGHANVLVAGLSGNNLAVSTGLEGPWFPLGQQGRSPAYPG